MDLICGINPVIEALSAGRRHFDRLLVVKGLRNRRVSEAISRASRIGVPLRFETRETLDRLAAGVPHQGVIAVVSPKPAIGLEDLLSGAHEPALYVVLDGVEDPRNLGAILRTVEAAGADGVLLPERHSAGLSETVNRASAGALEHVKVARIGNLSQSIDALKERGVWVIGLDASGERWDKIDFKRPVALVLGGEGRGLRRLTRERCDQLAALPLFGHVASLNVSVAAGAVLYEVVRQRGASPSHVRPIPPQARPASQVIGPPPDDGEVDPGWLGPSGGDEADSEPEDDEQPTSLSVVQIHEEEDAAWRTPEPGSPAERRGIARPHVDRDREHRHGSGRDERRKRRAAESSGGSAERGESEGPRGRRRRRRRGRRPNPGGESLESRPSGAAPPSADGAGEGEQSGAGEGAAVPNGNGSEATKDERRGRRRRRRRR